MPDVHALLPKPLQIADEDAGATLAHQVYLRLRHDIVGASFAPGEKLRTRLLCERYGVGLAPVREALTRLSREGLVVQNSRRGFAVPAFGREHLEELTRTRSWLNGLALRASIEYADPKWEEALILAFHRLKALPRYVRVDGEPAFNAEWEAAHARFHHALIAGCRSVWLTECCAQMFEAMNYYRHYSRITEVHRKRRADEHTQVFEAAMARDADTATALLTGHFVRTADLVQRRMAAEDAAG